MVKFATFQYNTALVTCKMVTETNSSKYDDDDDDDDDNNNNNNNNNNNFCNF